MTNSCLRCRRARHWIAGLLVLAAAWSCSGPTEPSERRLPRALTSQEADLVASDNLFGLKLFGAVCEAEPAEQNMLLSPLSVALALGMTLNGAAGETQAAMRVTLELAGLDEQEINEAYRSLIDLLRGMDPKVTVRIANSIWYRSGFPIAADFVLRNETCFDAVVEALDFSLPGAADIINAWVDEATSGLIDAIVKAPIPAEAVMYLINAIYFKGNWRQQFPAGKTEDAPFLLEGGGERTVPMMRLEGATMPVYYGETFSALDLAYGDSLYSMTVLLPEAGHTAAEVVAALDQTTWSEVLDNLYPIEFAVIELPRFELEYEVELKDVLTALGMGVAFDPVAADFSRMDAGGHPGLWIEKVKHKTFMKVDEKGTEAAAVTAVVMIRSLPPVFRVERPFVLVIRERHSGTILFIGRMMDPGA